MGNDEHSQNVFRKARELGLDPHAYCDQMERAFREVWAKLSISFDDFIRTTEPRHRAAVQRMAQACYDARRRLRRPLRGLVLRLVRGVQAGKGPGRRQVPDPPDEAGLDPGEELLLPAVEVSAAAARALRAHPEFIQPEIRRNEILRLVESGLEDISISRAGQSWGIPLPFDPSSVVYVWFDALINYAAAVGYGTDDAAVRPMVAGQPARRRQGHHAVPLRRVAGDADERGAAAADGGLRARLGALQGPEDEQVARHGRSIRWKRPIASAPIRCGCTW